MTEPDIEARKADHLDLCATDDVAYRRRTTLLEEVELIHRSLPELSLDEIDLSTELLGKTLRAPIVIVGMTGGHERAAEVNRGLASIAERRGYALGLGSQRAMQRRPETTSTYQVRDVAPHVLLLGNVGVVQAAQQTTAQLRDLVEAVGADALCVHMNPAQELIQPEGDRDFRGCVDALGRLVSELGVPVVAKETGNGISRHTAQLLFDTGVRHVDVSGAGGTSWVGVETLRAQGHQRELGELLWDWGVPTAAAVCYSTKAGHTTIATGGMRTGLDAARAIALGATAAGYARNVFKAFVEGGEQQAEAFLDGVERELRVVMLLTGCRTIGELRCAPKLLGPTLSRWLTL